MKKIILLICLMPLLNVGCGGDDDAPQPSGTETLNKELLYEKTWINKEKTVAHIFNKDGSYGTLGTWEWVNNSDTILLNFTNKDFYYIINTGNTDNSMEMRPPGTEAWTEFRVTW